MKGLMNASQVDTNGKILLHFVSLGERVVGFNRNSQRVLVCIDKHVWGGSNGWVRNSQRQGSDNGDTLCKSLSEVVLCQIENIGAEDRSVVVNRNHNEAIWERPNSKLSEQCSLGGSHFLALVDELHRGDDFDSALVNFGGNVENLLHRQGEILTLVGNRKEANGLTSSYENLEEGSLWWIKTGVSRWDNDVNWSYQTNASGCSDLIGCKQDNFEHIHKQNIARKISYRFLLL